MKSLTLLLTSLALVAELSCGGSGGSLLAVGDEAPDVALQRLDGSTFSLSSLRGRTVLLNFWFYH